MRILFLLLLLPVVLPSCAQDSTLPMTAYRTSVLVGRDSVHLEISDYGAVSRHLLLKLHDNEQTAEAAARTWLSHAGGRLITLENGGQRLLSFRHGAGSCTVDPNRIFSDEGIRSTLSFLSRCGPRSVPEVARLAGALTSLLPDSTLLIAVHNNTDSAYSVKDYLPGGSLSGDAAEAFYNPALDPDDFILTTDTVLFRKYRNRGFNCVLQSPTVREDGSLSVFYGNAGREYINIECEHGHLEQQLELLRILGG